MKIDRLPVSAVSSQTTRVQTRVRGFVVHGRKSMSGMCKNECVLKRMRVTKSTSRRSIRFRLNEQMIEISRGQSTTVVKDTQSLQILALSETSA